MCVWRERERSLFLLLCVLWWLRSAAQLNEHTSTEQQLGGGILQNDCNIDAVRISKCWDGLPLTTPALSMILHPSSRCQYTQTFIHHCPVYLYRSSETSFHTFYYSETVLTDSSVHIIRPNRNISVIHQFHGAIYSMEMGFSSLKRHLERQTVECVLTMWCSALEM